MKTLHLTAGVFLLLTLSCLHISQAQDDEFEEEEDVLIEDVGDTEEAPALEPIERPVYKTPVAEGNVFFSDPFDSVESLSTKWIRSQAKKDDVDEEISKYDGVWSVEEAKEIALQGDLGLVLKSRAKHHAISARLDQPFDFSSDTFVVQYEVQFQEGQDCGGAYIKLYSKSADLKLEKVQDKTAYTIMFGPDKCGNDNKLHFIFRHKNPMTKEFEEKHAKKQTSDIGGLFKDKKTHLYTLVLNSDNTYEVFVDQNMINSGSLLEDVEPPVNPASEIVDPEDHKPEDWDEREKIPDPDAVKPEDWDEDEPEMIEDESAEKPEGWLDDEPELIPDPDADKPDDWDDDMDGEWEAPLISNPLCESAPGCGSYSSPMIKNPKYQGKWKASMIENPEYKGKWKPKKIPNPNFFEDNNPYRMRTIAAVGLELWSMSNEIMFDNFIITDNKDTADNWAAQTWELKRSAEVSDNSAGKSVVQAVLDATEERPWLWAVFIVVVVLPVILIVAYCCMSGSSKTSSTALKKKKVPTATLR